MDYGKLYELSFYFHDDRLHHKGANVCVPLMVPEWDWDDLEAVSGRLEKWIGNLPEVSVYVENNDVFVSMPGELYDEFCENDNGNYFRL